MLRELLLSVASGIIVTLILQMFGLREGRRGGGQRQSIRNYSAPSQRGGLLSGIFRLTVAVVGGVALAYMTAPFVFARRFGEYGGRERFDRFDRFDGLSSIASHTPMLILTVISTVIVWVLLSALFRRQ